MRPKPEPEKVDAPGLITRGSREMVGAARIELATPAMSTQCSPTELRARKAPLRVFSELGDRLEPGPRWAPFGVSPAAVPS